MSYSCALSQYCPAITKQEKKAKGFKVVIYQRLSSEFGRTIAASSAGADTVQLPNHFINPIDLNLFFMILSFPSIHMALVVVRSFQRQTVPKVTV